MNRSLIIAVLTLLLPFAASAEYCPKADEKTEVAKMDKFPAEFRARVAALLTKQ